ncbi:LysO family transporter, partial [Escherichia coli]
QLRNSGMSPKQILINRRGTTIAIVMAISALAGGALAAYLLGLPTKMGLAIASGYGWYSLSGIVLTDAFGPVIGSTAFF